MQSMGSWDLKPYCLCTRTLWLREPCVRGNSRGFQVTRENKARSLISSWIFKEQLPTTAAIRYYCANLVLESRIEILLV